jgi:hypothetical protein
MHLWLLLHGLPWDELEGLHVSLDKGIKHGKEHRKQYRGSKAFDPSCRTNRCPYCLSNDLHNSKKRLEKARASELDRHECKEIPSQENSCQIR